MMAFIRIVDVGKSKQCLGCLAEGEIIEILQLVALKGFSTVIDL